MQKLAPRSDARVLSLAGGLDDVVEEAGNGEGTDAAEFWSNGGEIGAGADIIRDIAL